MRVVPTSSIELAQHFRNIPIFSCKRKPCQRVPGIIVKHRRSTVGNPPFAVSTNGTSTNVAASTYELPSQSVRRSAEVPLPIGVRVAHISKEPSSDLPFLLYLPDIDGAGVTSNQQWQAWAERFDMYAVMLEADCTCSFAELARGLRTSLEEQLAGTSPYRPVYLLGEGFGAVLALQLAWDCKHLVNRLVLVNPATSYKDSQLARITALTERLPPAVLNLQLPALPQLPFQLPLPPPPPLPVALAPLLGTSPQTLLRQLVDSVNHQQPSEAVQALRRALAQVEQISERLTPDTLLRRLKMLEEGIRLVGPRLPRIPQRTLVLAGGQDVVLGSEKEAKRLVDTMPRAFKKVLPDSGHALLYEPGGELLPLLEQEGFYTRRRVFSSPVRPGADVNAFGTAGPVEVPNEQEVRRYASNWTSQLRDLNSPVFLSTLPDGTRVLGLDGLPDWRGRRTFDGEHHHHHHQSHHRPHPQGQDGAAAVAEGSGSSGAHPHPHSVEGDRGEEADLLEGPLLFVGNHQLYAFDMSVMVEEVLTKRGILMRGLAHPGLFNNGEEEEEPEAKARGEEGRDGDAQGRQAAARGSDSNGTGTSTTTTNGTGNGDGNGNGNGGMQPAFMGNTFQSFGAVRVTPTAMYRLLAAGEAVLLYPGGVREGFKRRYEKYELFWPTRSEFVRMAARFGATIIPVSAVGLEDSLSILMDSEEIRKSPLWNARAQEQAAATPRARIGVAAEDAPDESFIPPLIAPAPPSRFYFLFGRPIRTTPAMYRDRAACDQLYRHVRTEVETGISYLLRKREQDPYRDLLRRYLYEQNPPFGPKRVAPTFTP